MTPFETRLAATPPRELPSAWRTRILANARPRRHPLLFLFQLPSPRWAWGSLAAAWIAIAALNLSGPRGEALYAVTPPGYRQNSNVDPAEMLAALREQHRLIETWIEQRRPDSRAEFYLDRSKL